MTSAESRSLEQLVVAVPRNCESTSAEEPVSRLDLGGVLGVGDVSFWAQPTAGRDHRGSPYTETLRGHRVLRLVGKGNKPATMPPTVPVLRVIEGCRGDRTTGPLVCGR